MSKRETLEEFKVKAFKVHGDRYDYSKVDLQGNSVKVIVVCKEHGNFLITPGHHKTGKGCRQCSIKENSIKCKELWADYLEFVKTKHDNKYSYKSPQDNYRPLRLQVICPTHGEFDISSTSHKSGKGCMKCAIENRANQRRDTTEDFIKKARAFHGDRYDYSETDVVNDFTKVKITCRLHGTFKIAPYSHKQGSGCKPCAVENNPTLQRDSLETFIEKARSVHGDKYSYKEIEDYRNDLFKVGIICKEHGKFWQTPNAHKAGKGCSKCAGGGYSQQKPGTFYILKCGNITKVGITNNKLSKRVSQIRLSSGLSFEVFQTITCEDGSVIYDMEQRTLKWLRGNYIGVDEKFDGYTECFYNVDSYLLTQFVSPTD